jgi:hypothetical protein
MPWVSLLISLIPEVVRGIIDICKAQTAVHKAEEERKKAEADAKKAETIKAQ